MQFPVSGFICLFNRTLNPVALDSGSGGYPYEANSIRDIHIWESQKKAEEYAKIINYGEARIHVVKATFELTIEKVKEL